MGTSIKSCIPVFTGMASLVFIGCGGGATGLPSTPAVHNEWTWTSGSFSVNQFGTYGQQGVASSGSTPGARISPVSFTDKSGNLWLFGGIGYSAYWQYGDLNDLWEYSNGQWIWVSGSSQTEQAGVYGTRGVPAPTNVPGARYTAVGWTDPQGSFWISAELALTPTACGAI